MARHCYFDDEHLNILDFLNHSLKVEYADIYEEIMSRYEAKLKTSDIFDHNFPDAKFSVQKIKPPNSQLICLLFCIYFSIQVFIKKIVYKIFY
jgi:hypothetical protein